MFNLEYEVQVRRQDAIRRADQERLVLIARTAHSRRKPVFKRVISRFGRSLCRVGSWLDVRYGAADFGGPVRSARPVASRPR